MSLARQPTIMNIIRSIGVGLQPYYIDKRQLCGKELPLHRRWLNKPFRARQALGRGIIKPQQTESLLSLDTRATRSGSRPSYRGNQNMLNNRRIQLSKNKEHWNRARGLANSNTPSVAVVQFVIVTDQTCGAKGDFFSAPVPTMNRLKFSTQIRRIELSKTTKMGHSDPGHADQTRIHPSQDRGMIPSLRHGYPAVTHPTRAGLTRAD